MKKTELAKLAVEYCVKVKKGDKVVLSGKEESLDFLVELYKQVILAGGNPIVKFELPRVGKFFFEHASKEQIEFFPDYLMETVKGADKYIGAYTSGNVRELESVDSKKVLARTKTLAPISNYIVNTRDKIHRCTIGYPCKALAKEAGMSLSEYEDFVYGACLQDWVKLSKKYKKIGDVFEKGREVHLIGDGVDLKFSIFGKNAKADDGIENMPGGEVYMAPVRESLEGWIKFEYPAIKNGKEVEDIRLEFKKGKVVKFSASKGEDFLKEMLGADVNAKYVGEFGIGCNPKVHKFTKNLLFDEKIEGTIHLALGMAYKENGGGNDSAIHWDIVKDMKKAKIILDGEVVQENGKWKIRGV